MGILQAVQLVGEGRRSWLPALAAAIIAMSASTAADAARRGTGLPPTIPGGGDDTGGPLGKDFVVHVKGPCGEPLSEAISRVKPGGKLVLHADPGCDGRYPGSAGQYVVPKKLVIRKNIAIMAAKDDEGHVELVFAPASRCLEISPPLAGASGPTADEDEEEGQPGGPAYADANMCKQPEAGGGRSNPTPAETVALCGLRITRDPPDDESRSGGRIPPCISVLRRKLYVEHTKIDAGKGPAIEAVSSPQVRMGTSEPGGIDRSVYILGYGDYGIRIDRKSNLLLNWTEIAYFGTGVAADGNIDLKRGVQIHDNDIGVMIGGGTEDADIFGPRDISIGVDKEVLSPPSPEHERPLYQRPEIYDNTVGIRVGKNFDGKVTIRSADIVCKFDRESCVGVDIEPSKFSLHNRKFEEEGHFIAIKDTRISRQLVGIRVAAPVRIGPNVDVRGNQVGIELQSTYDFLRTPIDPYLLTATDFPSPSGPGNEPIALDFRGYIDSELRLCNIAWPKLKTEWNPEKRRREKVGGIKLAANDTARFFKCYIDDLKGLKKSLWESSKPIFEQVCKTVVAGCPAGSSDRAD